MKKKIILTLTACLFAAGSIINVHLAQNDHNLDVSLADISVMAQADGESGDCPGGSCTFTFANGDKCTACCPEGKDPRCTVHGCECVDF